MKVKKILNYVKRIVNEYPKINSIIDGLELSKENGINKDINSFIKSKNKINNTTELQALKNINFDKKIEEYNKWQNLIASELENLKNSDIEIYKIVIFKFTGYSFEQIRDELYLGERTVVNLYNDFIIELSLIAVKDGLIIF